MMEWRCASGLLILLSLNPNWAAEVVSRSEVVAVVWGKPPAETYYTGVVIHKEGNTGLVLSARHMGPRSREGESCRIIVNPGSGSQREIQVDSFLEDLKTESVVLKLAADGLPPLWSVGQPVACAELMPVRIEGMFVSANGTYVKRTIPGTVSAVRRDAEGTLQWIQLEAALPSSARGGVVSNAGGRPLGVALGSTAGTLIVRALPIARVLDLVAGRPGTVDVRLLEARARDYRMYLACALFDPFDRLKSVRAKLVRPASEANGVNQPAPVVVELKVEGVRASGEAHLPSNPREYSVVLEWTRQDGSTGQHNAGLIEVEVPPVGVNPDGWLGSDSDPAKPSSAMLHVPVRTAQKLTLTPGVVADLTITPLDVQAWQVLPCLSWSEQTDFVYILELSGLVRKVSVPGLVEERQIALGHKCAGMTRTRVGLAVAVMDTSEVWLLDEKTLDVRRKTRVPVPFQIASSPFLDSAFLSVNTGTILRIDLLQGQLVGTYRYADVDPLLSQFQAKNFDVSPDGRFLLLMGDKLVRLAIRGSDLVVDDPSERGEGHLARPFSQVAVSPDALYVASGSYSTGDSVEILRLEDFRKKALSLTASRPPMLLAYDQARKRIYTVECDSDTLSVYSPKNAVEKQYNPSPYGQERARQILVHPDGGKFLYLTDRHLWWAEMPPVPNP